MLLPDIVCKELTKYQRDVFVERYQTKERCNEKKKELNIPWNAVRALNNKQRKYGTTMTLQKPMKRREQIREAIKRPR